MTVTWILHTLVILALFPVSDTACYGLPEARAALGDLAEGSPVDQDFPRIYSDDPALTCTFRAPDGSRTETFTQSYVDERNFLYAFTLVTLIVLVVTAIYIIRLLDEPERASQAQESRTSPSSQSE